MTLERSLPRKKSKSKNIFSAFKSAREAYKARKAEIASERIGEATQRRLEARAAIAAAAAAAPSSSSSTSSRREHRSHKLITAAEDGTADESQRKKDKKRSKSRKHRDDPEGSSRSGGRRGSADTMQTETTLITPGAAQAAQAAQAQSAQLAMLHHNASLLTLAPAAMFLGDDPLAETLQGLLMTLQNTIDEMSCITAGIGALIAELQKVPDTLAVVGLTLAEISTLVAKISPAAIMGMKSAFPIIFGLLSSPQFAVVAGVGMAATVVVLGGLRIVANMAGAGGGGADEEEERDLDLEFGVTQLPDDIEEPVVPAPPPQVRRTMTEPAPIRSIMPAPTQLENSLNTPIDDKELRRRMKRRESESAPVKSARSDKSPRSEGGRERERERSHKERPKMERGESSRRHERGEKSERREKRDKSERHERHERSERSERGERHERSERGERHERGERGERHERSERGERSERHERSERGERSDRHERSDKKKKEKELPPLPASALPPPPPPAPSKFSLMRRATAPALPAPSAPQTDSVRPGLSKRSPTGLSIAEEKGKAKSPKKKLLGFFEGRS